MTSTHSSVTVLAWKDWWAGTRDIRLWWTLAWYDTLLRYRRSVLGPMWLTISMGLLLIGMGPIYAGLFGVPLASFFPFLSLGIILWSYFAAAINDGCAVFISSTRQLKSEKVPLSLFVWRANARNLIQLMHHMILYIPVALWAGAAPTYESLFAVPGLFLVVINLHSISIILGICAARYRDIVPLIASMVQFLMFLTPVFWPPEKLPKHVSFILLNPLAVMLEVLRSPLMGITPRVGVWLTLLVVTAINIIGAALLYRSKCNRVVFWV